MPRLRYVDEITEVVITDNIAVVHDKTEDKYFQMDRTKLPDRILNEALPTVSQVAAPFTFGFLWIGVALLVLNVGYSLISSPEPTAMFFVWFVPYILISVIIHERAHLVALRIFGRKHDKVGFKMHYIILPAFFVQMNQSVLLARNEKIVVHAAGIWVNLFVIGCLIMLNAILIGSDDLGVALTFAVVTLSYNAVPVLNSDGYRVLLALADVNELKERKRNPRWIRRIKTTSWILVVCYGCYIGIDTYLGLIHG